MGGRPTGHPHERLPHRLTEMAERVPELYALLRKHGHVAPVIRLQADPVIAGDLLPGAPEGTGSHPDGEAVAAVKPQTDLAR